MSTPPPFDPELTAALEMFGEALPSSITPDMIPTLRAARAGLPQPTDEELSRDGALVIADHTAPGPAGQPDIMLLVARPAAAVAPVPALYFVHGGGMILGNRRQSLPDLAELALELGIAIVSVEYRLAPEHPHPAPVEDCYAGLEWTAKNAAELGIDPERIIVGGGSAGGGLAAAVVLMARDRGGPAILGQLLICPMLDDRNDTPSAHQMAGLGIWDRTANETGWTALLGSSRGGPDVSPYAAPARATDLSGLPPAFIDVGSAETFRDEDVDYAVRIWRDGGRAELHVWPGGFHGFDGFAPQAALSQDAKEARLRWLRRLLGG
ncbi:alpha/beta hydrolase [Nonomuraea sp. NPDC050540]|uniref:alpha/beta hydrolase n=1 Tax=Nonomuraea sp. NPDC050540 TaxID=3364367 RepID=UPI00379FAB07